MSKFRCRCFVFAIILTIGVSAQAKDVTLVGETVGIKVYTDGLVVTDTTEITTVDGKKLNIAKGYGIEKGDIIKKVNRASAISAKTITDALNNNKAITITLERAGKLLDISVSPAITKDGKKLGLWLRDSTAGLGTITCIDGDKFYALGHGICDIDTGSIMPVKKGIIQKCTNVDIVKGSQGTPGAITGDINDRILGNIYANSPTGISGNATGLEGTKTVSVAETKDVEKGSASILCNVDGEGVKEYSIDIKRIALPSKNGKDMIIEITDPELIEKTGGIIQGMSGSPILQNGKFVGAVTHVFINTPTRGYGILAENMLSEKE